MEKIAILSSGPSVLAEWELVKHLPWLCTVAISTTAWRIRTDWVAYIDPVVKTRKTDPIVGYISPYLSENAENGHESEMFPLIDGYGLPKYTLPNAINWALRKFNLQWDQICVIGNDRNAEPNIGGLVTNHDESRWEAEDFYINLVREKYEDQRN